MTASRYRLAPLGLALVAGAVCGLAMIVAYRYGASATLFVTAALAVLALAWVRPLAVLYLAVLAIPLELYTLPVGQAFYLTPAKALLILSALGWAGRRLLEGRLPLDPRSPLTKPFGLMLVAVLPGLLVGGNTMAVVKVLVDWAVFFLLYQMIAEDGRVETVRNLLITIAITGVASGALALISTAGGAKLTLVGQGMATGRAVGEFLSPNALGVLLAIALPAVIALAARGPLTLRPAALIGSLVIAGGVLATLSRGAALAALGGLAVMLAWTPFRRSAVIAACIAAVAAIVIAPSLKSVYVLNTFTGRVDSVTSVASADPRLTVWRDALSQFASHPLFGVGADNFQSRILGAQSADPEFNAASAAGIPYVQFPNHAHDIVLNFAAELGLLGLAALAWVTITLVRLLGRSLAQSAGIARGLAFAIAGGLAAVALEGIVDYPFSEYALGALVVVLAGCAAIMGRQASETPVVESPASAPGLGLPSVLWPRRAPGIPAPAIRRPPSRARPRVHARTRSRAHASTVPPAFVLSDAAPAAGELHALLDRRGRGWMSDLVLVGEAAEAEVDSGRLPQPLRMRATGLAGLLVATFRLRRKLQAERPMLVYADGVRAALVSVIACRRIEIPVVWRKRDGSGGRVLGRAIARRCRTVIGVSEAVTAALRPALDGRIQTVPAGIPHIEVERSSCHRLVHETCGWPPDAPVMIHVAPLAPDAGTLELIEVIAGVLERLPNAKCLLVAPSVTNDQERSYFGAVRRRVADLGVSGAVKVLVGRGQPLRLAAGCELALLTGVRRERGQPGEPYPVFALQAMAVGIPVVGYDDDGLHEIAVAGARLVGRGNRTALREAIVQALGDESVRARMAARAQERARSYELDAVAESLEHCLHQAAAVDPIAD